MKKIELGTIVKFTINELTDSIIDSELNIQDIIKIVKQLDIKVCKQKFTKKLYEYFSEEIEKTKE